MLLGVTSKIVHKEKFSLKYAQIESTILAATKVPPLSRRIHFVSFCKKNFIGADLNYLAVIDKLFNILFLPEAFSTTDLSIITVIGVTIMPASIPLIISKAIDIYNFLF